METNLLLISSIGLLSLNLYLTFRYALMALEKFSREYALSYVLLVFFVPVVGYFIATKNSSEKSL